MKVLCKGQGHDWNLGQAFVGADVFRFELHFGYCLVMWLWKLLSPPL